MPILVFCCDWSESKELAEIPTVVQSYRLIICGDDQVFSPYEHNGLVPGYFLSFPSPAKFKMSFAASFGSGFLCGTESGHCVHQPERVLE